VIILKELIIYSKKNHKKQERDLLEIDNDDLEFFGHLTHGKEFLNIPSFQIGNKTILEWFEINGFSSWWFISPVIHPKYKEAMVFIDRLNLIIKQFNPEIITLRGIFDKKSLIEQICKLNKIKFNISNNKYFEFNTKNKIKSSLKKSYYKKIFSEKNKKRIKYYDKKTFQNLNPGYALILSPGIYRRTNFDPILKKSAIEEFYVKPFLDYFKTNNIEMLCVDVDYTFRGTTETLTNRIQSNENWIALEDILLHYNFHPENLSKLKKKIIELTKYDLSDAFRYKQISLWDFLKPTFRSIFLEPYIPFYFEILNKFELFLKSTKPSIIIQVYEAGPYAKSIELAAKKLGIKTIGIQHGLIPSDYPDYMAKEIQNDQFPLGNIVPDLTLVFGPFYHRLLTEKGGYLKPNVKSIGNPTFYNIKKMQETLSKTLTKNSKKSILIPLSFRLIKKTPDREILDELFSNFKSSNDIQILIRPHPGDSISQNDFKNLYPSENFILTSNSLVEDLYLSDLVILLPTSTVSTESILFKKPVILVDILNNNEIDHVYLSMVEHNLAKIISLNQIKQTIDSIFQNDIIIDEKNWKNFVNDFFNYDKKIDFSEFL